MTSAAAPTRAMNGDLNNTLAIRPAVSLDVDPAYNGRTFAICAAEDDAQVRANYRPFILDETVSSTDWVAKLELSSVLRMVDQEIFAKGQDRLRVLVLYGSMRAR
jgi:arsenic resistance protein ArsH